jgi:hypothetical protein
VPCGQVSTLPRVTRRETESALIEQLGQPLHFLCVHVPFHEFHEALPQIPLAARLPHAAVPVGVLHRPRWQALVRPCSMQKCKAVLYISWCSATRMPLTEAQQVAVHAADRALGAITLNLRLCWLQTLRDACSGKAAVKAAQQLDGSDVNCADEVRPSPLACHAHAAVVALLSAVWHHTLALGS